MPNAFDAAVSPTKHMDTTAMLGTALLDVPDAAQAFYDESMQNKLQTAERLGSEFLGSVVLGGAIGYILPARGPAAVALGLALTVPMVLHAGGRVIAAGRENSDTNADSQAIAFGLAKDGVSGAADFVVNSAGGWAGAEGGMWLAKSDTVAGAFAQQGQRLILKGENEGLLAIQRRFGSKAELASTSSLGLPKNPLQSAMGEPTNGMVNTNLDAQLVQSKGEPKTEPEQVKGILAPWLAKIDRRVSQYGLANRQLQDAFGDAPYQVYKGTFHAHTVYDDGMGLPAEVLDSAKERGLDIAFLTPHNHSAARGTFKAPGGAESVASGVPESDEGLAAIGRSEVQQAIPNDPRPAGWVNYPIIAESPAEMADVINSAKAATEPGKFYGGFGIEAGTIGPNGHPGGDDGGSSGGSGGGGRGGGRGHGHGAADGTDTADTGDGGAQTEAGVKPKDAVPVQNDEHSQDHLLPPGANLQLGELGQSGEQAGTTGAGVPKEATTSTGAAGILPDGMVKDPVFGLIPQSMVEAAHRELANVYQMPAAKRLSPEGAKNLATARLTHHGGVNHIGIFGIETSMIVADRAPHPQGIAGSLGLTSRGVVPPPDTVHYPDGDYLQLSKILANTKDVTGNPPIVQFNHPRASTNLESDYGILSFKSENDWLQQFVWPYVRLIEVVKGEALNPDNVTEMKPRDFDPRSFAAYISKRVKAGVSYGEDAHFLIKGGPGLGQRPAGTGVLASELTEQGVFDAMRNRRTFASTNYAGLQGVLTTGDGKFYMGSILDQAAVPDLSLKLKIGGNIDPAAQYKITLLGDEVIGDGQMAQPVQDAIKMSGAELLKANQEISFEPIQHKLGDSSAYWVQVDMTGDGGNTDHLLTSPIWVEPLSGASHGLWMRAMVGSSMQYMPFVPKAP